MTKEEFLAVHAALWLMAQTEYQVQCRSSHQVSSDLTRFNLTTEWIISEGDMVLFSPSPGIDRDGEPCFCDTFSNLEIVDFAATKGWQPSYAWEV